MVFAHFIGGWHIMHSISSSYSLQILIQTSSINNVVTESVFLIKICAKSFIEIHHHGQL